VEVATRSKQVLIAMRILNWFSSLPDTTKVALIALCGVVISAFVAWLTALRGQYVNAVTVERSKWINALRENIATFSGALRTLSFRAETMDENTKIAAITEINRLISLIHLQLNPRGTIERNIATILEQMPALAEKADGTALRSKDKLLIAHCQWLLKAEWEKVKYEARWLTRPWLFIKRQCYLCRYHRFSQREGRIA
jgi:hypothetical protein